MKNIFIKTAKEDSSAKYITLSEKGKYEISISSDSSIKVNKRKLEISIEDGADGFTYIVVGSLRYPVEILEANQNKYQVLINGVSYKFSVETPISFSRKKHLDKILVGSGIEEIIAPMPGKILEVLVEEGQIIKENDPLLVLEAMKMANEIKSHISGKVKKIHVKAEDIVMKDDLLIEIEK